MCRPHYDSGLRRDGKEVHCTEILRVDSSCRKGADPGVAVAGVLILQLRPCTLLFAEWQGIVQLSTTGILDEEF